MEDDEPYGIPIGLPYDQNREPPKVRKWEDEVASWFFGNRPKRLFKPDRK